MRRPWLALTTCVLLAQSDPPAFRTDTQLVQFTLIALDRKGYPITDLRKDEIILQESGAPRDVAILRFEGSAAPHTPKPLAPGHFSNRPEYTPAAPRNVTAIVLDKLNTSPADGAAVRSQVMSYVRELAPGTQIAIYEIGDQLTPSNDFAAELNSQPPAGLPDKQEILSLMAADNRRMAAHGADVTDSQRRNKTLLLLEAVGDQLTSVPGRKSLIWISAGMPIAATYDGWHRLNEPEIRATAQRLASNGVTVYAVDAKGLQLPTAERLTLLARTRLNATMDTFAEITGGRVSRGTNDFARSVEDAAKDALATYTVGFYTSTPLDETWRKLDIRTTRKDVQVRAPQGYLAKLTPADTGEWPEDKWRKVIAQPAVSAGLPVDARFEFSDGALRGAIQVPVADLLFRERNGKNEAGVDLVIAAKKAGGTVEMRKYALHIPHASAPYATITGTWALLPESGTLRVIVRDRQTGRHGSIDIPAVSIPAKMATAPKIGPQPPDPPLNDEPEPAGPDPTPDPFLDKARAVASKFVQALPRYIVKQETRRSVQYRREVLWRQLDQISAQLQYERGKELITSVLLNDKPADPKEVERTGSWSTGQFGDALGSVFDPASKTAFRAGGTAKLSGRPAHLYRFSVRKERSTWQLSYGSQTYVPAYEGTIWFDPDTAQTLRFEMRAKGLPRTFPLERAETATEYRPVRIGSNEYYLPASSISMGCFRGHSISGRISPNTRYCSKNEIEYRDYREFTSESTIKF